jgi:hypothetical protein
VNEHDRALVIGISRYADAAADPPWITNLNGPDVDADAIDKWLRKETGGGLPDDNVTVIRSANFPDPTNIGPQQKAIVDGFTAVKDLPTNAYEGHAGRRLYVYVSGHGLAHGKYDAAVITAEATRDKILATLVNTWFDWFWYAGRFKEYVLWSDICASRDPTTPLLPCPWNEEHRLDASEGRQFIAYAAGFGKIAVENEIEGEWHGAFTYALLNGLNGALGTPVTSADLQAYIHNSLATFMTEKQRNDSRVGHEPAFGTTDPLLFGSPPQPLTFTVTLQFPPDCGGRQATISGDPTMPPIEQKSLPANAEWEVDLAAGAYAAYVPELDRAYPFAVTGGGADAVITLR